VKLINLTNYLKNLKSFIVTNLSFNKIGMESMYFGTTRGLRKYIIKKLYQKKFSCEKDGHKRNCGENSTLKPIMICVCIGFPQVHNDIGATQTPDCCYALHLSGLKIEHSMLSKHFS